MMDENLPQFIRGDRVFVPCVGLNATVIKQTLSYDGPESFWGNVELLYDDGIKGVSNSWQIKKIKAAANAAVTSCGGKLGR